MRGIAHGYTGTAAQDQNSSDARDDLFHGTNYTIVTVYCHAASNGPNPHIRGKKNHREISVVAFFFSMKYGPPSPLINIPVADSISVIHPFHPFKGSMKRLILLLMLSSIMLGIDIDYGSNQYRFALVTDTVAAEPRSRSDAMNNAVLCPLTNARYGVTAITFRDLSDASVCAVSNFNCIIFPSTYFPNTASNALVRFIRDGGDLLLLGGRAFADTAYEHDGAWRTRDEILERMSSRVRIAVDCDLSGDWRHDSDEAVDTTLSLVPGYRGRSLSVRCDQQSRWDMFSCALPRASIATDANVLTLMLKADANTPSLAVEITKADGTRLTAKTPVTTNWRRRYLSARSFRSVPSPTGNAGLLSDVVRIGIGFRAGITQYAKGMHAFSADDIGTLTLPDDIANDIHFSFPDAFDTDACIYTNACAAVPWTDYSPMLKLPTIAVLHGGISAVGMSFPGESMSIPLLSSIDEHGRREGIAAGMAVYFGAGRSNVFGFFGVHDEAFYRTGGFAALITDIAGLLASRTLGTIASNRYQRMLAPRHSNAPTAFERAVLTRNGSQTESGRRSFMIGVNHFGSFDSRFWQHWNPEFIEEDFRRMTNAGINVARLYGIQNIIAARERFAYITSLARAYGIYLLPVLVGNTSEHYDRVKLTNIVSTIAAACRDEPSIIGYDLQNEPYPDGLSKITNNGKPLASLVQYADGWKSYVDRTLLGARTFRDATLPLPARFDTKAEHAFAAYNGVFDQWISWQIKAIRAVDARTPITVGYDSFHALLPANNALDFVSYHAYEAPLSLADIKANMTVLDRLRKQFPKKVITLGEFGYSTASLVNEKPLDEDAASVAEFAHYLYAFANGYGGVMKWCLNDWPVTLKERYASWVPEDRSVFNAYARMGMYRYAAPLVGVPKPIVYCTRFLRSFIDEGGIGGTLTLRPSRAVTGTGYCYSNTNALFIGDTDYADARLSFSTGDDRPVNVLLRWDVRSLTIAASRDMTVTLKPSLIGTNAVCDSTPALSVDSAGIRIRLFAGGAATFTVKPR